MHKKSDFILRLCLIIGDALALILSFASAYAIRVHVTERPYIFESELLEFVRSIALLVPIMLIIIAALGLYKKSIFLNKSRLPERTRLLLAAVLSESSLIVYDFFAGQSTFNASLTEMGRALALMSMALAFIFLLIERILVRFLIRRIFKSDYAARRVILIGNSKNTEYLANYIASTPESGYRLAGIVASKKFIPGDLLKYQRTSLKDAITRAKSLDAIFQTDETSTEYVYSEAVNRHLLYYFVPSETALSSHFGDLELVGSTPTVLVKLTPLTGGYAVTKRLFDLLFSTLAIIIAALPMLLIWLTLKLMNPKAPAIYSSKRLTRYNREFKCYKFRSMKPEYSGLTPEEAFAKMEKPTLIEKYRKNGDYLKNDPRITKFGHFLRETSLDELPQLFNILKGDISLIGPRALLPGELRDYGDRSLILTVKSGLTGFAQVSGRRNISFEERRALDIYYVRNWSLALDAQIFFKTIVAVLKGEGAK